MKVRAFAFLLTTALCFSACNKNTVSNIPSILLVSFGPGIMQANVDVDSIIFNIADGDADLGNNASSQIYWKDSRYDTGFTATPFPAIDQSIEIAKKGLTAVCTFYPVPQPTPRPDSLHQLLGDTLTYEFYIKDRAGNSSNHIITSKLIVRL